MMGRPRPKPRRPKSYPYPATRSSFIFSSSLGMSSPTLTFPPTLSFAPTSNFADLTSNSASKIQKWIDQIGEKILFAEMVSCKFVKCKKLQKHTLGYICLL